jgi:PIN domain nuclease of toxin-antitoxin system
VIVLDTHALIWWISTPDRIPRKARRMLDTSIAEKKPVAVSSISTWEIAMLVERGRLELTIPVTVWIAHLEEIPWLSFVPVDNRIAVRSVQLEGFPHRDPADRIIVATAVGLNATLITADDRLRSYTPVRSAWD